MPHQCCAVKCRLAEAKNCVFRPVFEGCFSEEPLPYSDPTGAAGGGNCRLDSPNQDSRIQRTRGQDSRGHGHTPQNRPHGHQPPDLPEGYGQLHFSMTHNHTLHSVAFPVHGTDEGPLRLPLFIFSFLKAEQRTTVQGQVYFLHTQTGVSTWHDPRIPRYAPVLLLPSPGGLSLAGVSGTSGCRR